MPAVGHNPLDAIRERATTKAVWAILNRPYVAMSLENKPDVLKSGCKTENAHGIMLTVVLQPFTRKPERYSVQHICRYTRENARTAIIAAPKYRYLLVKLWFMQYICS